MTNANEARRISSWHWARQREAGALWGMRITLALLGTLGRKVIAPLVYVIVFYFFLLGKKARHASLEYLQAVSAFSPKNGETSEQKLRANTLGSFRHFMSFADAIIDKFFAWQGKISWEDVDLQGQEIIQNYRQQGIGGIMITAHVGNMEVCRALASRYDMPPLTVLVHTHHARNFNHLLEQSGARSLELLQVTDVSADTAIQLQERIQQGGWIVIMGDRVAINSQRNSITSFLGKPAAFPQGPYILANLLKCPTVLLSCTKLPRANLSRNKQSTPETPSTESPYRAGPNNHSEKFYHSEKPNYSEKSYRIKIEPFAEQIVLRRKTRDTDVQAYVARYSKWLERYCAETPLQWFNFFQFWKLPS
ncbi:Hypothetical protein HDN1F_24820 [gamma proteobacterium HdN1]|nr:Hypothetical protein HDN1F_24820 [gamma proteobacterium HdN1]